MRSSVGALVCAILLGTSCASGSDGNGAEDQGIASACDPAGDALATRLETALQRRASPASAGEVVEESAVAEFSELLASIPPSAHEFEVQLKVTECPSAGSVKGAALLSVSSDSFQLVRAIAVRDDGALLVISAQSVCNLLVAVKPEAGCSL